MPTQTCEIICSSSERGTTGAGDNPDRLLVEALAIAARDVGDCGTGGEAVGGRDLHHLGAFLAWPGHFRVHPLALSLIDREAVGKAWRDSRRQKARPGARLNTVAAGHA